MDPADIDLARLSQQVAMVGIQAARAYNEAQSQLDLANVLAPERLPSAAGWAASRQTLSDIAALTTRHKEMFSKFITGATAQLMAGAEQLTETRRAAFQESLAGIVNRNLGAQSRFYEGRERWIAAAQRAIDLAQAHEGEIWIEDGGLVFATEVLLAEFSAVVAVMDEIHEAEVAEMGARQAHIAAVMSGAG